MAEDTLVPLEKYLEAGVHIGSRFRSGDMHKFIYKCRSDGLCVLDVNELDRRIKIAAKFLARYEPERIAVVAGRTYAQRPAEKFAELTGTKPILGRFPPGTFTNPSNEKFIEPKILFAADPPVDKQSITEAKVIKIPVVSLCGTSNMLTNIDLAVPINNKGKKSLALVYWLLAKEILKEKEIIKSDKEYKADVIDFESKVEKEAKEIVEVKVANKKKFRRGKQ